MKSAQLAKPDNMSYSHSKYVAGIADVIKHACLASAISRVEDPCVYFETHAGAGTYKLDGQNGAWVSGIKKVLPGLTNFPAAGPYLNVLRQYDFSQTGRYPASPCYTALSSQIKQLLLCELNVKVAEALKINLPHADVYTEDGFEMVKRTGADSFVFCDPPYKEPNDYQRVVELVATTQSLDLTRLMVWFPIIFESRTEQMIAGLKDSYPEGYLALIREKPANDGVMTGFGLFCSQARLATEWPAVISGISSLISLTEVSYY